jgi:hypothetical protein
MSNYDYTIESFNITNNKTVYICKSDELNISFITNSKTCSLSFNLEYVSMDDIKQQLKIFHSLIPYTCKEIIDNPLDYNMVCEFNDNETNESIIASLNKCFNVGINRINNQ